jgi:hypothetical protein
MSERWLSRKEAATYLTAMGYSISPRTLANYASDGSGPPYRLWLGVRAQYDSTELVNWANSRTTVKH